MTQQAIDAGFEMVGERRDGSRMWSKRVHPFLTYHLTVHPNGMGDLSWELALGEYFRAKGLTFSAQDELSLFVFPATEITGMVEGDWLKRSIERMEEHLAGIDLVRGT